MGYGMLWECSLVLSRAAQQHIQQSKSDGSGFLTPTPNWHVPFPVRLSSSWALKTPLLVPDAPRISLIATMATRTLLQEELVVKAAVMTTMKKRMDTPATIIMNTMTMMKTTR